MRVNVLRICVLGLLALSGCDQESATPVAALNPSFAKPTSPKSVDPLASWTFVDAFVDAAGVAQQARIRGDSRDANGGVVSTGESTYTGGICGVEAQIFVSNGGGDAVLDPDKAYKRNRCPGGARYLVFDLGGSVVHAGAFTNAFGAWHLLPGEARDQEMRFRYSGLPNCEVLRFSGADGLSAVRITRVDDGSGARAWNIESLPNADGLHVAGCFSGSLVYTGTSHVMAFRARIVEVK